MSIQIVELDLPFGADIPSVHCPVCGAVLQKTDAPVDLPTCKHLEFAYVDAAPGFMYIKPHLEEQLQRLEEESDDEDFQEWEAVETLIDEPTTMIMSITSSGMGCGPTSVTAVYAVTFKE